MASTEIRKPVPEFLPAGTQEKAVQRETNHSGRSDPDMTEILTRKGAQLELHVWQEAMRRKREKEKKLADAGNARDVTISEIIREAFRMKV